MKSQAPIISIAIPCFAQAGFLKECLDSIIAQSLNEWEAFVVDDASPEDPRSIVDALCDSRIIYIKHERNRGQGAARNTAFAKAKGHLLLCLDADDALHSEFLFETRRALERDKVDCAFSNFWMFDAADGLWENKVRTPDLLAKYNWLPGPGTLMRKAVWERVGGYCEAPELIGMEDYDFWIGAMTLGLTATCVPKPLYLYRRHANSYGAKLRANREIKQRIFIFKRQSAFFSHPKRTKWFLAETLKRDLPIRAELEQHVELQLLKLKILAMKPSLIPYFVWINAKRVAVGMARRIHRAHCRARGARPVESRP